MSRQQDHHLDELMHKAQAGDVKAYNKVLTESAILARGFVSRRISDQKEVEDVVQEILIGLHRASHTYNHSRHFKPWFFAIADHKLKDYLRKFYRRNSLKEVDFEDVEKGLSDVTKQGDDNELLYKALESLPKRQQQVIKLLKIEGYTAQEIAVQMDMSLSAVKVMAHRGYKKLKDILTKDE